METNHFGFHIFVPFFARSPIAFARKLPTDLLRLQERGICADYRSLKPPIECAASDEPSLVIAIGMQPMFICVNRSLLSLFPLGIV